MDEGCREGGATHRGTNSSESDLDDRLLVACQRVIAREEVSPERCRKAR